MGEGVHKGPLLSPPAKDFLAGALGGTMAVFTGQPLDTIRIRLQQKGNGYGGINDAWRRIAASEGPLSLFKGMSYPLATATFQNAVTFYAYGAAIRALSKSNDQETSSNLRPRDVFCSGLMAGGIQAFVLTPVDLLKIRLQIQTAVPGDPHYVGPLKMLGSILRERGIPGLFRGLSVTLLRDIPGYGVFFYAYHEMKQALRTPPPPPPKPNTTTTITTTTTQQQDTPLSLFISGGVAGMLSMGVIYPFDVIKSRMQVHDRLNSPYKNWMDCGRKAIQGEGWRVMFRGLNATLWHSFVASAAIFLTYEASMHVFDTL